MGLNIGKRIIVTKKANIPSRGEKIRAGKRRKCCGPNGLSKSDSILDCLSLLMRSLFASESNSVLYLFIGIPESSTLRTFSL